MANAELYYALREAGVGEKAAMRVAEAIPPKETLTTKGDLIALRAAIPAAETLADKAEVEVLKAESETTKGLLNQILVRQDNIEKRLAVIEKEISDIKAGAKFDRRLFIIVTSVVLSSLFSLLGFVIMIAFFS